MKIAVLTTTFPRWAEDYSGNFIFYAAAAHVQKGAQVRVVAPHAKGARSRERLDGVEVLRFRYAVPESMQVLAYGGGILTKLQASLAARLELPVFFLSFLLRSVGVVLWADVVHAHWTLGGVIAVVLARLLRKPVVLTVYGIEVFTARAGALTKFCIRWADHVICISRATEERMREMVGPECQIRSTVIPYGIREDFLTHGEGGFDVRAEHGVPRRLPVILSLGRLIERKGIEHLLRAAPMVIRESPAHFIIGGEGPERSRLQTLAAKLGVGDAVTFAGAIPSAVLPSYYDQCDVFAHPIITDPSGDVEGLGIVLLEAMARGKPTIASAAGGVPDVVIHGETGFLVPEADHRRLADQIVELLRDPSLRQAMGSAGRRRVEQHFCVRALAGRVMQVYASCQAGTSRP